MLNWNMYNGMNEKLSDFQVRPRLVNSLLIVILFIETEMHDAVITNC